MTNLIRWVRDIVIGIVMYATAVFLVIVVGQFLTPKGMLSMAPVYAWINYISRPDIIVTMLGVAIAVKYASQAPWVRALSK